MSVPLSVRLSDSSSLLSACKMALPNWSSVTMDNFTSTKLKCGFSSPAMYLVSCSLPGVVPAQVVIKLDVDTEDNPFFAFYKRLATKEGPYQGRIASQLGEAGLGPRIFYLEKDQLSPYWGLIVMEYLSGGAFDTFFDSENLTENVIKSLSNLLARLHLQSTREAEYRGSLLIDLVSGCGVEDQEIQSLHQRLGGYGLFLIYWWKILFPAWIKSNKPAKYPLPKNYTDQWLDTILNVFRIQPKTTALSRLGLSHCDIWFGNLMKHGDQILAVDFEAASSGPAFVDIGGIFWKWKTAMTGEQPHLSKTKREAFAISYFNKLVEDIDNMDDVLYDLELAFLHTHLSTMLWFQLRSIKEHPAKMEEVGTLLIEKTNLMARQMKKALEDKKVMEDVVENGVYQSIRHQLSEGLEERVKQQFAGTLDQED